jgi:hypothetical protein
MEDALTPEQKAPHPRFHAEIVESGLQSGVLAREFRETMFSTPSSTFPGISDEWYLKHFS